MSSADTSASRGALRVAVMNDYEVVVAGLRAMLEPFEDRVEVVELDSRLPVLNEVDVLLYDAYSRERPGEALAEVVAESEAPVVLLTWHLDREVVDLALERGVAGCLSKGSSALEVVEALEKVATGSVVVSPVPDDSVEPRIGEWPGRAQGLTARESEVMALIAQGLTNQDIAERAFISLNSVKTHIRAAYRKVGVERRAQAVLWATQNGFTPDRRRTIVVSDPQGRVGSPDPLDA